jgi:hypothetical protein
MLGMFKKQKPDQDPVALELDASRSALFMPQDLTREQCEALQGLLDVARRNPEQPIIVSFSGKSWHISKNLISFI